MEAWVDLACSEESNPGPPSCVNSTQKRLYRLLPTYIYSLTIDNKSINSLWIDIQTTSVARGLRELKLDYIKFYEII